MDCTFHRGLRKMTHYIHLLDVVQLTDDVRP